MVRGFGASQGCSGGKRLRYQGNTQGKKLSTPRLLRGAHEAESFRFLVFSFRSEVFGPYNNILRESRVEPPAGSPPAATTAINAHRKPKTLSRSTTARTKSVNGYQSCCGSTECSRMFWHVHGNRRHQGHRLAINRDLPELRARENEWGYMPIRRGC